MMHILNKHDEISKIKSIFNYQMPYPNTKKLDDLIDSKSKPLHSTNISIDDIDNEVNDPHPTIFVTLNIMIYDLTLSFNHIMDQTKNHNF